MARNNSMSVLRFVRFVFVLIILTFFTNIIYAEEVNENLLPNGSFEVTTVPDMPDCWDQFLGPKKVKNWYSLWKIDKNVAFHGKQSLCITVPSHNLIGKLYIELYMASIYKDWLIKLLKNKLKKIEKNQYYTLSVYLKSNKSKFPVLVIIKTDNKGHKFKSETSLVWKRKVFTFYLNSKLKYIRIYPLGVGKVWIDAVKLEKGKKATKFTSSPYDTCFVNLPEPKKFNDIKKKLAELGWEKKFNVNKALFHEIYKHKIYHYRRYFHENRRYIESHSTKVNIDPVKRCILVNGKPFFFFAACFMQAHLYKTQWNRLLRMLKAHGYTTVIASFSCRWNDSHASIPEIRRFLDLAYRYGLKVIIWINPNAIKDKNGKFKAVKNYFPPEIVLREYKREIKRMIVPLLKNHPALLGWYLYDEPCKKSLIRSGFTKKIVEFARKLDNCHLLYINYGNLLEDYKFYKGKVPGDIVSRTQYPIPVYPITYIAENTAFECVAGEFKKPVVLWLQLWGGRGRYPTPDEFTCMAYLAAIYGATGFQTWPMMPSSKLLWDRVKVVISEMKEISSVLYSRNTVPFVIEGSDYIHAIAKRLEKKVYLLAVNVLDKEQKVMFTLPNLQIKKIYVKFEGRWCPFFKTNRFKDVFKPYERHVYEIDLLNLYKKEFLFRQQKRYHY